MRFHVLSVAPLMFSMARLKRQPGEFPSVRLDSAVENKYIIMRSPQGFVVIVVIFKVQKIVNKPWIQNDFGETQMILKTN